MRSSTSTRSGRSGARPTARVAVKARRVRRTEYELYIPAGIWTHTAVKAFLDRPLRAKAAPRSPRAHRLWRGGQRRRTSSASSCGAPRLIAPPVRSLLRPACNGASDA